MSAGAYDLMTTDRLFLKLIRLHNCLFLLQISSCGHFWLTTQTREKKEKGTTEYHAMISYIALLDAAYMVR